MSYQLKLSSGDDGRYELLVNPSTWYDYWLACQGDTIPGRNVEFELDNWAETLALTDIPVRKGLLIQHLLGICMEPTRRGLLHMHVPASIMQRGICRRPIVANGDSNSNFSRTIDDVSLFCWWLVARSLASAWRLIALDVQLVIKIRPAVLKHQFIIDSRGPHHRSADPRPRLYESG